MVNTRLPFTIYSITQQIIELLFFFQQNCNKNKQQHQFEANRNHQLFLYVILLSKILFVNLQPPLQ